MADGGAAEDGGTAEPHDAGPDCSTTLRDGLIAHWKLDEASGGEAADSAGANVGTLFNGPIWRPSGGKLGGALELDGVDDYVEVNQVFRSALSSFSVSVWVQIETLEERRPVFTALNGHNLYPRATVLASGNVMFQLQIDDVINGDDVRPEISVGRWEHLVFVFDQGAGNLYSSYVNGLWQGETDFSDGAVTGGSQPLLIGKDRSPVAHFQGLIDELRVYDRALSASEVTELHLLAECPTTD